MIEFAVFALVALLVALILNWPAKPKSDTPDRKAVRAAIEKAFQKRRAEAETHDSSEKLLKVLEAAEKAVITDLEKIGAV